MNPSEVPLVYPDLGGSALATRPAITMSTIRATKDITIITTVRATTTKRLPKKLPR
jgi:hypothetical protein